VERHDDNTPQQGAGQQPGPTPVGARALVRADRWQRVTVKARWYDDHFDHDGLVQETIPNVVRSMLPAPVAEQEVEGLSVEAFFDLFEA
jgi:hypothetical protein